MIWFVVAFLTVMGLVFLGVGLSRLGTGRNWPAAEGTVVSHEGSGEDVWFTVVRFTTADGRTVQAEDNFGSSLPRYRKGRQVAVRYDPADPRRIVIGAGRWMGLVFALAGLAPLTVAVAIATRAI